MNPYPTGQQQSMPPQQQQWQPTTNINQQMANMNLGPQKPPQQFQPQPLINNNNPSQNMMLPPTSINNNNQFPQPPINGLQNGSQMPPMANKPPSTQFPSSNLPPQNTFQAPQTQQLPPSSVPQTMQQQLPNQQGQRPPIPGLESSNPMQNIQNGQMQDVAHPQMPPLNKTPQPIQQQTPQMPPVNQFPQNVPFVNQATAPLSNMQPQQQQNQFPGMPPMPQQPQQQFQGMPPMSNQSQQPFMQQRSMPPMPGQQPMVNQQPNMSGQPPMPGQQPHMPGQQPHMPGQQPPMPGQFNQQYSQPQMQFPGMPAQPPFQSPGANRNINQPPQMGYQQQQQPGYPTSPMQAAAPQKRLDPDQMPNPIQVMAENQRACGGVFSTLQIGQVPPLVTTQFISQDQGNSGPRFMRSTMYNIPANTDMMKQSAIPFALIISPFAKAVEQEMAPPIVDFGEIGPIRCVRCKAYMSPYMQFVDAGRRFQCLLCKATTEVPAEYFQHLDHTGQRVDKYERPELVLGTYEFVATKDYCRNNTLPKPPAMIFVIDVSYNNVKSGLVHLLCSQMKRIIKNLPVDQGQTKSKMRVGFITYDKSVHFYNIKSTLAQPQQLVVGDIHEMFMPLLDGFLADPDESEDVIDQLMEQIPKMYGETRETETILMPAIQAGLEALKASECAGKLLVFHSTLPIADAPGQLKNRDDRKLLGTEKERTVLTPQNNIYNNLGQDCCHAGCTVDLFLFNNAYIDLATIGQVSRLTGGEVYKYTYFQSDIDGERLVADICKNVNRPVAFDTVMRVRTSTGTRPTDFYGHFFMSNTTDMEIAGIDCDKSVAVEIRHDDKLPPEDNVYVQVALLYTSCGGQRRLRILNLALKTCTQLADLFRSCDLDTLTLFLAKQGISRLLEHSPKVFRDNIVNRAAQILACYRKHCASPTSAGQLILPECLKLLPLYISCLLKNDAFSGGSDITLDDRSYAMYFVCTMDLPTSVIFFYPRLIPIHNVVAEENTIPAAIRCTIDKMSDDGAYILDNGVYMFLWLGIGLSTEFTQSVFGAQCTQQIDTERSGLPVFDNPLSKRIRGIVETIQKERTRCMRIALVRQRDKLESVLRHFLIEDRGTNGSDSYVDFLCFMHKEIRSLLS
ncbi:hypothetical protein ACKWTF_001663 [Chironomus riparius]